MATGAAFGALIVSGRLELVEGLVRLAFALAVEYLSDIGVWLILELDGCELKGEWGVAGGGVGGECQPSTHEE